MKRADQRKHHYIYKITRDDGSGKYYIGMHSTDNMDDGYFGSGTLLAKSIAKHGKEKHIKEVLEHLPTREALKLREKEIVNEDLLGDKKCMNLKLGGEGGGRIWGLDHLAKFAGKAMSLKAQAKRKDPKIKLAWDSKLSAAMKKHCSENQEKFAVQQTLMTKAALSEEAKQKRLNSFAEIKHQQGESNSQFGKCWITNGVTAVRIPKDCVKTYIADGYRLGRKIDK